MKVEDPPALLVQWFYHKSKVLPKGDESSWKKYTKFAARNATPKPTFIATEKMLMVIKSICARSVAISGRRKRPNVFTPERRITHPARSAAKPLSCTMTRSITATTAAATRSAITLCSCQSLPLSQFHPCPSCSERRTSNGCAIRFM